MIFGTLNLRRNVDKYIILNKIQKKICWFISYGKNYKNEINQLTVPNSQVK